jgi:hypothetical protein
MQDVVEQVMRAYGLMVNLTPEEEQAARDRLEQFLKDKSDDTRKLAVEGMKFLRGTEFRGHGVPETAFQICWLSAERIARHA